MKLQGDNIRSVTGGNPVSPVSDRTKAQTVLPVIFIFIKIKLLCQIFLNKKTKVAFSSFDQQTASPILSQKCKGRRRVASSH